MNNHILSNIDIDIKVDQTQSPHAAAKPKYCILILMLLMLLMFIDKKTQGVPRLAHTVKLAFPIAQWHEVRCNFGHHSCLSIGSASSSQAKPQKQWGTKCP